MMTRLFAGTPWDRPPQCERCGKLETDCQCAPLVAEVPRLDPAKQTARLALEKRAKGKWVTVVRGLPTVGNDLPVLLAQLKQGCGTGGTLQDDALELQGKQLEAARRILQAAGFRVV